MIEHSLLGSASLIAAVTHGWFMQYGWLKRPHMVQWLHLVLLAVLLIAVIAHFGFVLTSDPRIIDSFVIARSIILSIGIIIYAPFQKKRYSLLKM